MRDYYDNDLNTNCESRNPSNFFNLDKMLPK